MPANPSVSLLPRVSIARSFRPKAWPFSTSSLVRVRRELRLSASSLPRACSPAAACAPGLLQQLLVLGRHARLVQALHHRDRTSSNRPGSLLLFVQDDACSRVFLWSDQLTSRCDKYRPLVFDQHLMPS
jgi:hypothetical protein